MHKGRLELTAVMVLSWRGAKASTWALPGAQGRGGAYRASELRRGQQWRPPVTCLTSPVSLSGKLRGGEVLLSKFQAIQ